MDENVESVEEHDHHGHVHFADPRPETPGPLKWHKYCSRKHRLREGCGLVLRERKAKSGATVLRWTHTMAKKSAPKTKARRD